MARANKIVELVAPVSGLGSGGLLVLKQKTEGREMNIYYVDGEFVPEEQARLPVTDLAILRGFGVFDFLRTYNGVPFHLQDHLVRLERSARLIGLAMPCSRSHLTDIVHATLARNNHDEANIRMVITGGGSSDLLTPGAKSRLMVLVTPAKEMPPGLYRDGVKVVTTRLERIFPGAKTINYIPGIVSLRDAADREAVEAVHVDRDGYLLEGTTSNIFAFVGENLVTPPADRILPGITRQVLLELAAGEFAVEVRRLHREEIPLIDEALLSSSNREVMPVVAIDAQDLSTGRPGPRVGRLMAMFADYAAGYR